MKKRLISLLLIASLLLSVIAGFAGCVESTTPSVPNNPDDSHICNFSGKLKFDGSHHWRVCSCGKIDEKVEHSGGVATTTQKAICSECGAYYGTYAPSNTPDTPHECSFSDVWESDDTYHWHECSCGKIDEKVEHSGGVATTTEQAICSVCNEYYGSFASIDGSISIEEFNSSFDTLSASSSTVKVSGVVYAGDNYGLYITDGNQNTLYIKYNNSIGDFSVGQVITATGYANLYYSLPQLMASSVTVESQNSEYSETPGELTVAQIVSANNAQKNKVFDHPVYRVSGTLTFDNNCYYIVDGSSKIQFKSSTYAEDYGKLDEYLEKKITVDVVLSDCYTTTGVFRVSLIPGTSIEVSDNGGSGSGGSDNTGSVDINFIMINDTHGAFTDSDAGYSIGRVDSLVEYLERTNGDYIFIHNGDAFQGSYLCGETFGLAMIEALNASDLDCFVIGNHEFDWGIDKIAAYADGNLANGEADFPFLGANIYYKGTTTRPDWIDPYAIIEQDGLKVGVIGVIGDSQESSILTRYVKDYDFVDPVNIIKSTASYLRDTEDCDVVVVATHDYDSYLNQSIAALSGSGRIDAIFCAHTHENISESVTRSDSVKIPVVQCSHKNNNAQEVIVTIGEDGSYESFSARKYYPSGYDISSDVAAVIARYQDLVDEANEVIGNTSGYLSKSTLGAYAVDAMLKDAYAGYNFGTVDVAIINTGGIRATINSGSITRAEVFEVFPFNNSVVLVNLSGKKIKELYSKNSNYLYIDVADSIGSSYSSLKDSTIYQLAVIDYVFEGTYYTQFNGLTSNDYVETTIILRDLLMAYLDNKY